MRSFKAAFLLPITIMASFAAGQAAVILTPSDFGTLPGSQFASLAGAFDNQPTWDGSAPVGGDTSFSGPTITAGRYGYIDFGENWASFQITETWTSYTPFTGANAARFIFAQAWWDDDIADTVNEGGAGFLTTLNFGGARTSGGGWFHDLSYGTPIVPLGRYLNFEYAATPQDRINELAIVGTIVPEPSTAGLLPGVAALAVLRRRKNSAGR